MSTRGDARLGPVLSAARARLGASLDAVAAASGCSAAYVHKLEQDRVRTPSPRVLAGLSHSLGISYADVMRAAGYEPTVDDVASGASVAPKPLSNAHIVALLEDLRRDVHELRGAVEALRAEH
jgi:transcriptional regulator with XRE-family HTH domain